MINILLVDDHASSREPLAFLLDREPDFNVVAQAGSLAEARQKLAGVDVAVVDLSLPDGDGLELVRDARASNACAATMVLTASCDRTDIARAFEAGAAGVLHKSAYIDDIKCAVRRLSAGELLLSPGEIVDMFRIANQQRDLDHLARQALEHITPREREVLQALAEGLSDKSIAERLHISSKTVRTHMASILAKLGVESRLQALVFAVRHGIVSIGSA